MVTNVHIQSIKLYMYYIVTSNSAMYVHESYQKVHSYVLFKIITIHGQLVRLLKIEGT